MSAAAVRPWVYVVIAALFQVAWVFSLKRTDGLNRWLPLAGYLLFGLGSAVFLSMAMKLVPMGTAYAAWMGLSIVGATLVDVALLHEPFNAFRLGCTALIVAGACGLSLTASR
jgi:quaternary ammonium compound-resistance protein SugE